MTVSMALKPTPGLGLAGRRGAAPRRAPPVAPARVTREAVSDSRIETAGPFRHNMLVALPQLRLKIRVHGRHPWFFRKMIQKPSRALPAGSAATVVDREGRPVGTGFYNARCELALRMLSPVMAANDAQVDTLLRDLLTQAVDLRERVLRLADVTNAYRLAHAEGDGLPGFVLDKLGDALVARVASLGTFRHLEPLGHQLLQRFPGHRLVLTVDDDGHKREGIERPPRPEPVETEVVEHGVRFAVTPGVGHKTGFFADQRDARQRVRALAQGRTVLDLFCHAGGFALAAAAGAARRVVAVDLDETEVARAKANAARNKTKVDAQHGDAFDVLRDTKPGAFDLVVLDPPKWADGRSEVEAAMRRYQDLNRLGLERVASGGIVVTCSCSGAVTEGAFLAALRDAAAQARRDARLLWIGGAGPDHPIALECQQTRYLKVVVLQVR